jgi:hypothetical protein
MRTLVVYFAFSFAAVSVFAQAKAAPNLETQQLEADRLKASAEASRGEACTEICLEAAQKLAELSNQNFIDGHIDAAQANMRDAGKYAVKAGREAIASHKRQKKTEIGLRRLATRMKNIEQTLNFEDRPPVKLVINSVESVRSDLLSSMFGNPKKSFEQLDEKKKEKQ